MKILIAEDEPITQRMLANMLKEYGEITCADNGQDAFDYFIDANDQNTPFDFIFLDIMMPGFDGQETLIAMREYEEERFIPNSESAKIIITSSLSDGHNIYEAHLHGCDNYLLKPVSKNAITKVMQNHKPTRQYDAENN
jgi:CheY-like chemotaxis protein